MGKTGNGNTRERKEMFKRSLNGKEKRKVEGQEGGEKWGKAGKWERKVENIEKWKVEREWERKKEREEKGLVGR